MPGFIHHLASLAAVPSGQITCELDRTNHILATKPVGSLWRQSDNVPFEQSRNALLTAPSFGDAGRTTTDDPSRS
jgi:hypothetical protein